VVQYRVQTATIIRVLVTQLIITFVTPDSLALMVTCVNGIQKALFSSIVWDIGYVFPQSIQVCQDSTLDDASLRILYVTLC